MKKKLIALLLSIGVLLLSGCASQPQDSPEPPQDDTAQNEPAADSGPDITPSETVTLPAAGPVTATDQAGREVTLEKPAETVVSCCQLATASLLTLGQKGKLAGIETQTEPRELYRLCAPELLELPGVGSDHEINIEAIAALEPDLVLLPKEQLEAAETLAGLGIPAAVTGAESYESYNELIALLGKLCGCEDAAGTLIEYYDIMSGQITMRTLDIERPTVFLCGPFSWLQTCTDGMYQKELIEMAGGACVSSEIEGQTWADITAEQLAAWDPEMLFTVEYAEYSLDDIRSDPALAGIRAVKENRLYTIPSEIEAWDYPQPSSILGLLWMTHILHPELISEEEYLGEAASFFETYLGIQATREQLGMA